MKVVIDARESGTSTGRYVDKLVENLHGLQSKHEFVILTKAHRIEALNRLAPTFTVTETPFQEFSFGEQIGFKKQIESLQPDLVHFCMVQQPVLYQGRVVTTMHDLTTLRFRNPSKNRAVFTFKQAVYKWVNKRAAHKSRLILTASRFVKDDIVALTHVDPEKIILTYEAADVIQDTPIAVKELENRQFIMYVGRPLPHKNLGRLLEAFALLQATYPDLYLVLAGKTDPLFEDHKRRAEKKGIKNVIFTGFVSDGELRWLYEHTACYVFPSLSEGFGLPGLEAMAHGTPVASSNATCLPEIYGDAALYFDPLKSRGIADTITQILQDKTIADALRKKGRVQAGLYSWRRTAQQTLEAYDRALS